MSKNTSVALGDYLHRFVEQKVREGRFGNASEVVRAGLRLLEERETKIAALRAAVQEGLDSGPAQSFDVEELLKEVEREVIDD